MTLDMQPLLKMRPPLKGRVKRCKYSACQLGDPGQLIRVLKYWTLAFRGVGQHNYAHECAEVLVRWRYELTDKLRRALERAWFVNRWGLPGRFIASDLYLEQLNFGSRHWSHHRFLLEYQAEFPQFPTSA
ncbi:hypothetical protein B0H14DRAFT_2616927 [Mycena olivaceomarginata]|nr:hypothetical protein B0H14DRAFT_2616927 [Mycena olivaceomarginata]